MTEHRLETQHGTVGLYLQTFNRVQCRVLSNTIILAIANHSRQAEVDTEIDVLSGVQLRRNYMWSIASPIRTRPPVSISITSGCVLEGQGLPTRLELPSLSHSKPHLADVRSTENPLPGKGHIQSHSVNFWDYKLGSSRIPWNALSLFQIICP